MLTACITPQPLTETDLYKQAQKNIAQLFSSHPSDKPITLTYEEALARGVRHNYDYRLKLVNNALQAGQLRVAEFTMFPDLKTTASLYTRNNDFASFGITTTGQQTDVLNSTPRTLRTAREGLTWNILDFGMGYIRAKQQGNRVLIAEEESRKQLQLLAQDIRIAYWKAYSAQQLLVEAEHLQNILNQTEGRMKAAIADELVPKEAILKYRNVLLSGDRQLIELTSKLSKALIDLKRLLKLPLDAPLILKAPPSSISRVQNLDQLNFKKLDTISLVLRPELRSQDYMTRIAKLGVSAAVWQVFPGITLNEGWNYNSNKFLINNIWIDKSVDVSWSLLNLASLPASHNAATTQVKFEELKGMALTLAVMTQTRYAYSQYVNLAKEYRIVQKQAENADALYKLTFNRNLASLASKQEVVYAKLQAMIAKMDRDLILADLSTALGELYLSAGFDILPPNPADEGIDEALMHIRKNFHIQENRSFTAYVDATYNKIIRNLPAEEKPASSSSVCVANKNHEEYDGHPVKTVTTVTHQVKFEEQYDGRPVKTVSNENLQIHAQTPSKLYTLQIFGSYTLQDVKKMRQQLVKTTKNVRYGCTKFNGRDWYVLTYGTYVTPIQAKSSERDLPSQFQHRDAFARNIQEINWSGCESHNPKLITVIKKSVKKNLAVKLIKGYQHHAMAVYKSFINSWIS